MEMAAQARSHPEEREGGGHRIQWPDRRGMSALASRSDGNGRDRAYRVETPVGRADNG
ncbi:hypothetical protein GCM10010112_39690 [Actinoplanes lobatus]|uniref:Uncharacterized protein n=1 Tax=Actinoplanes lobatus TaxID=113568 RepID=A0ABQ4AWW9_9ACTN|nr:hypothetical protein GCM10010112_39690 [Actinoplanes lobatus]GIE45285.1 hypothetical protein Alo02nite_81830 [Actinoplanes lobatus]